jgi:hypothetical protein
VPQPFSLVVSLNIYFLELNQYPKKTLITLLIGYRLLVVTCHNITLRLQCVGSTVVVFGGRLKWSVLGRL